jgi:hypothetical protein
VVYSFLGSKGAFPLEYVKLDLGSLAKTYSSGHPLLRKMLNVLQNTESLANLFNECELSSPRTFRVPRKGLEPSHPCE